jgi:hypothetical protein
MVEVSSWLFSVPPGMCRDDTEFIPSASFSMNYSIIGRCVIWALNMRLGGREPMEHCQHIRYPCFLSPIEELRFAFERSRVSSGDRLSRLRFFSFSSVPAGKCHVYTFMGCVAPCSLVGGYRRFILWHDFQEQTSIARQWRSKHIPAATNTQTAIEELPFLFNGEIDMPL